VNCGRQAQALAQKLLKRWETTQDTFRARFHDCQALSAHVPHYLLEAAARLAGTTGTHQEELRAAAEGTQPLTDERADALEDAYQEMLNISVRLGTQAGEARPRPNTRPASLPRARPRRATCAGNFAADHALE
jgi:hypothetical protein